MGYSIPTRRQRFKPILRPPDSVLFDPKSMPKCMRDVIGRAPRFKPDRFHSSGDVMNRGLSIRLVFDQRVYPYRGLEGCLPFMSVNSRGRGITNIK